MLTIKLEKFTTWLSQVYKDYILPKPKRLKLREWAKLEDIRKLMAEHAENGGWLPISELIVQAINTCGIKGDFKKKPWYYTASLLVESQLSNQPQIKLPMLNAKEDHQSIAWDYIGRDWYWWLNLFANNYGWDEGRVAGMDIDEALALFQEIQVDDQMDKEWQHRLSEQAYEYDQSTKKSKFKALPRPSWMRDTKENYKPKPEKKVRMKKSMLPQGLVINDMDEEE